MTIDLTRKGAFLKPPLPPRADGCCPECGGPAVFEQLFDAPPDAPLLDSRVCAGECERFQCAKCRLWYPYDFGAADDHFELCDECAVTTYPEHYR